MKHFRWMAAMVAATLFLAACGSMQEAGLDSVLSVSTVADTTVLESDDAALFADMATADYWLGESGPGTTCWVARDVTSTTDFSMYEPTPVGMYTWTLAVVTKFARAAEGDLPAQVGTHFLFQDPANDAVLETGGYDQVILCKVENEPEEEPEWCSPGFWRNSPIAAGEAAAAGGYALSELYSAHFDALTGMNQRTLDRLGLPTDPTLQQVLDYPQAYGGPAFNNVGDKLSGAHPDVNFTGERVEDSCPLSADASRRS